MTKLQDVDEGVYYTVGIVVPTVLRGSEQMQTRQEQINCSNNVAN